MSHEHSFSHNSTTPTISLNENDKIIVRRECEGSIVNDSSFNPRTGRPSFQEESCNAKKAEVYEIRSVTDNHKIHNKPENNSSVAVMDGVESNSSVHVDSLEEVPEWVGEVIEKAKAKFRDVDAKYFMCHLGGAQISMMLATSESEYNVTLNRVGERIEEN